MSTKRIFNEYHRVQLRNNFLFGRTFCASEVSDYPNKLGYGYGRGDIKYYLLNVRIACFAFIYGDDHRIAQTFRYNVCEDLGGLSVCLKK